MPTLKRRCTTEVPVDELWPALLDPELYVRSMPSVEQVEVVTAEGDVRTTRWRIRLRGAALRWRQEETIDRSSRVVRFELTQGELKTWRGSLTVEPGDDPAQSVVILELRAEFGLPVVSEAFDRGLQQFLDAEAELVLDAVRASYRDTSRSR
jgi:hypothetical protein